MPSYASLVILFLFSFLTSFRASAQEFNFLYRYCPNTTIYSRNSTYFTNLRTLLSSLSSRNASYSTGFQSATVGQAPNRVTGLFLCRGDLSPEVCRRCVSVSLNQSLTMCPEEKEAVLYYEECMLRYSHQNILSNLIYAGGYILMNANNISSNQADNFGDLVSSTLNQAALEATNSSRKFYTTKANWTALQSLYVLVQCTPDLRRQDCLSCLQYSINGMVPFNRLGGRLLYPNCNSRYELSIFYNETAVRTQAPPPLLPPPASTSPVSSPPRPGKDGNSNVLVVAIVVPIIVAVLLFIAGYCLLAKRTKKTSDTAPAFDDLYYATGSKKDLIHRSGLLNSSTMTMDTDDAGMGKTVMCLLTDPEGTHLGSAMYIPQNAGPLQLTQLVNKFLDNEEMLPYSFYVSDEELLVPVGTYLEKNKVSVEKVLTIVYQQQAVFRIRPVNRCSQTIAGHEEAVLCVSFSPDGKQLASGSGDTTVRLWDLYTETPLFTCKGHRNWVLTVAWSPDGKHLVSGSKSGEICCWNPKKGELEGSPLTGHKKWITGISWEPVHLSSPCRRFVTSSKDGDARIWDITLKKSIICLSGHTLAVTCVKWGGDGIIYTGSQDCTIKMWETTQGKLIRELKGHGHWINSLALSTEYVLRTGAFDHTGRQYPPNEEKQKALERYKQTKGDSPERLVSGSDDFTMFLWEPSVSKQSKKRLTGHQQLVNHVYFSPDGKWIASASFDKSVRLWNGITGQFVTTFRGHVGPVYQISWSADSRMLLSGSKDSTLKIWEIRTKKLKQDLPGHADEVFAVDWSPDGEKVVSGGKDRVLKLWKG